jgi:fumarate reductase subunit D
MARSNEPIFWSLFSAGGVVAAFFFPITILISAFAVSCNWISAEGLHELAGRPLARLYIFVLISLPLFHWAHRFRYVALDLGFKGLKGVLPFICYGAALLGTGLAAFILGWG